jgi:hypothetical protein
MNKNFSDYIVYVDESGDHSLDVIDKDYPYFVLAFCVFHKQSYIEQVVPQLQAFKFKFYGHDMVVLHEHEIRKSKPPFNILLDQSVREPFLEGLNTLVEAAPFSIIASVIDKQTHLTRYGPNAQSPYDLALLFCMERLQHLLEATQQGEKQTHIVLERRGRKEDDELELVFRRHCDQNNFPFHPMFAHKQNNSAGLQLADLVARPIGRHVMNPDQPNRAYDRLRKKLYQPTGSADGWGLKVFPK